VKISFKCKRSFYILPPTTTSKFRSHFSPVIIALHFRLLYMLFKFRNLSSIGLSSWQCKLLGAGQTMGHLEYSLDYLAVSFLLFFYLTLSLSFCLATYLFIYPSIIFSFMSACGPNTRDSSISEWSHLGPKAIYYRTIIQDHVVTTKSCPRRNLNKLLLVHAVKLAYSN
jgi:hypothetical protein